MSLCISKRLFVSLLLLSNFLLVVLVIFGYENGGNIEQNSSPFGYSPLITDSEERPIKYTARELRTVKRRTTMTSTPSGPVSGISFHRTLFIVSNGRIIRLLSVRECRNRAMTTVRIANSTITLLNSPILKCPWFFAPMCDYVGFIGSGHIDPRRLPTELPSFAQIQDKKGNWLPIQLIDSRVPINKPHQLSVCLQPIYLMADWTLLPHFIETWIANGATLFFIYIQTVAPEFASLLQMYVDDGKQNGYTIEIVSWAPFPDERNNSKNANEQAYRTEVASSINDCLMRSRGRTKYVVSSDMDEILSPMLSNETLLQLINRYSQMELPKKKKYGAFTLLNSFAYADVNWTHITHPSQLSFDAYKSVRLETKVWERGRRSKVIMIPEAVRLTHVHAILRFESPIWTEKVLSAQEARVFHFRQVGLNGSEPTEVSTHLNRYINQWNGGLQNRIQRALIREQDASHNGYSMPELQTTGHKKYSINDDQWINRGKQVLEEIERCRTENYARMHHQCVTQWTCRSKMESIRNDEWIEGTNHWVKT